MSPFFFPIVFNAGMIALLGLFFFYCAFKGYGKSGDTRGAAMQKKSRISFVLSIFVGAIGLFLIFFAIYSAAKTSSELSVRGTIGRIAHDTLGEEEPAALLERTPYFVTGTKKVRNGAYIVFICEPWQKGVPEKRVDELANDYTRRLYADACADASLWRVYEFYTLPPPKVFVKSAGGSYWEISEESALFWKKYFTRNPR